MSGIERGRYYVFEGADFSGKSTQRDLWADSLESSGRKVHRVREPGATFVAENIRKLLLHNEEHLLPESELYLFSAARTQLRHETIHPFVSAGADVVSDRSWMSAAVYQGYAGGVDTKHVMDVSRYAMGDYFKPDGSVIIDMPVEALLKRKSPDLPYDRFEARGEEFFRKVVEGYRWLAHEIEVKLIDGDRTVAEVQADVARYLGKVKGVRRN